MELLLLAMISVLMHHITAYYPYPYTGIGPQSLVGYLVKVGRDPATFVRVPNPHYPPSTYGVVSSYLNSPKPYPPIAAHYTPPVVIPRPPYRPGPGISVPEVVYPAPAASMVSKQLADSNAAAEAAGVPASVAEDIAAAVAAGVPVAVAEEIAASVAAGVPDDIDIPSPEAGVPSSVFPQVDAVDEAAEVLPGVATEIGSTVPADGAAAAAGVSSSVISEANIEVGEITGGPAASPNPYYSSYAAAPAAISVLPKPAAVIAAEAARKRRTNRIRIPDHSRTRSRTLRRKGNRRITTALVAPFYKQAV